MIADEALPGFEPVMEVFFTNHPFAVYWDSATHWFAVTVRGSSCHREARLARIPWEKVGGAARI